MAFSYSSISKFETCAAQYFYTYIEKSAVFVENDAQKYGSECHDFLDKAINNKIEFTPRYEFLKPVVKAIQSIPGEIHTEFPLAFNADWSESTWFAKDSFIKGKSDVTILHPTEPRILIKDHKFTGKAGDAEGEKYRGEMEMFVLLHSKKFPGTEQIDCGLLWLKERAPETKFRYTKADFPEVEDKILGKIQKIEDAICFDRFPRRPSGLCYGWCNCVKCPNWKPKKDKR